MKPFRPRRCNKWFPLTSIGLLPKMQYHRSDWMRFDGLDRTLLIDHYINISKYIALIPSLSDAINDELAKPSGELQTSTQKITYSFEDISSYLLHCFRESVQTEPLYFGHQLP